MTFGGHSLFVARVASFAAERINTQGQIVQIYFKRKDFLTRNHVAGCKFHLQPTRCRLAREKQHFREGSLSFGCVRVVIMAVFILETHYPSGRTWANICSSSGYASLV